MAVSSEQARQFKQTFDALVNGVSQAIVGKQEQIELAFTCLFSEGHLLLEDVPGTGKTLLAQAVAATVGGAFNRIQFTPDMLPTDVTGVEVWDQGRQTFSFRPGPILETPKREPVLIALTDEINRASPKTQAALLEVMGEGHVTIGGERHNVPHGFMVIATQNPIEQAGTYALPEAQLDRFLMRTTLGYPSHEDMIGLLNDAARRNRGDGLQPVYPPEQAQPSYWVPAMRQVADQVTVRPEILALVSQLAVLSRPAPYGDNKRTRLGVSTRGCLSFVRCAKTWAIAHGRGEVGPDDIVDLIPSVFGHRILLTDEALFDDVKVWDAEGGPSVIRELLEKVNLPHRRKR